MSDNLTKLTQYIRHNVDVRTKIMSGAITTSNVRELLEKLKPDNMTNANQKYIQSSGKLVPSYEINIHLTPDQAKLYRDLVRYQSPTKFTPFKSDLTLVKERNGLYSLCMRTLDNPFEKMRVSPKNEMVMMNISHYMQYHLLFATLRSIHRNKLLQPSSDNRMPEIVNITKLGDKSLEQKFNALKNVYLPSSKEISDFIKKNIMFIHHSDIDRLHRDKLSEDFNESFMIQEGFAKLYEKEMRLAKTYEQKMSQAVGRNNEMSNEQPMRMKS
jgi:hypothetical protein